MQQEEIFILEISKLLGTFILAQGVVFFEQQQVISILGIIQHQQGQLI
jgi:hypothetical protein